MRPRPSQPGRSPCQPR